MMIAALSSRAARMELPTFLLAVLLLELTPGPNMAYLATLALSRGRAAGLIATAGVACGLAVHALVAGFGAGVLILEYPLLYGVLRWTGVAFLLYLAWEGWQTNNEVSPGRLGQATDTRSLFLRGFLSNVFNPKSILFFVSVLPTFVITASGAPSLPTQTTVFGILYVGIATGIHASIVVLAAQLRPWLVSGPRQIVMRRALSVVLALVAIWLAWTTRR
jgi:threonine/homoserine/homoserine lactone efflux protein